MGTDSSTDFLKINDQISIKFQEDWNVGIGGGLWSTGLALAHYFIDASSPAQESKFIQNLDRCKASSGSLDICELGSGNGFLSAVLAGCLLSASVNNKWKINLVVTDLLDHLDMMRRTMQDNGHIIELDQGQEGCNDSNRKIKVNVMEHSLGCG